jgi:uncharacterized repeat protein (TIGR04052 family)
MLLLAACQVDRKTVELKFVPVFDGRPISCHDTPVGLSDLRFFISELALIDVAGKPHKVQLLTDGRWQDDVVALLDLEDGRGSCLNGTRATNSLVHGTAEPGAYVAVRFVLGVPFGLNHANPMLAQPPLSDPAMHWHWRSGYKFMRIGIVSPADGFWTHLGSTGCRGTVQHIEACSAANRVAVELPLKGNEMPDILIDLSVLAASTDLTDQQSSDCSSGPAEVACKAVFAAFGLISGQDDKTGRQRLFVVRK